MTSRAVTAVALGCIAAAGCERAERPAPPPTVSLSVSADAVKEADNPTVEVTAELDAPTPWGVTVRLGFSGSATRGRDYAAGSGAIVVAPGARSGSLAIDVYRDFDAEGDETVTATVFAVAGHARTDGPLSVTLNILDGEAAAVDKSAGPEEPGTGLLLLPFFFGPTEEGYAMVVSAANFSSSGAPAPLVAEWSTDIGFATDVHLLGRLEIAGAEPGLDALIGGVHEFLLPLRSLAPNRSYFVRVYLGDAPPHAGAVGPQSNGYMEGFATDAHGRIRTRCEAPARTPGAGAADPLFAEQWHLRNTGQTAFSRRTGTPGADLRMDGAIGAGRNGAGVKLAIVDTGLEICHPDLAANTAAGGSYHFAHETTAGASPEDPFNPSVLGDHGTSVAGVAAAAAGNGLGGRGVAPEVTLVGFNLGTAAQADPEAVLFGALGGSESNPASTGVDIFNMSFGTVVRAENPTEDFVRLMKMGTTALRGGRGALYVKAAGNGFDACEPPHPLNREVGCIGANTDPEQNVPWLINVGAFNAEDVRSSYSSPGANLWVVGPGGEDGTEQPAIVTTDQAGAGAGYNLFPDNALKAGHPLNRHGDYVNAFGGTSAAAPAVSGAIAVLLEINPALTWRDVKHILAASARKIDPERGEVRAAFNGTPYVAQHAWQRNAAGRDFHNWYGFGAVDVDAAVAMASGYTADLLGPFVESPWFGAGGEPALPLPVPDADGAGVSAPVPVTGLPEAADIEAVVLEIAVEHGNALDLGITLRSPAGTASVVNPAFNAVLDGVPGLRGWRLLSNAFYGESPNGEWAVHVADLAGEDVGRLTGARLRFYYGEHP